MRVFPLLALLGLAAAPALAHLVPPEADGSPTRLSLEADPPDPIPAGANQTMELEVQRRAVGEPIPGRVNVTLREGASACGPEHQTVLLDPLTGNASARIECQPVRPGNLSLAVEARATTGPPSRWNASLKVLPDALQGTFTVGPVEAYRFPVTLALEPEHLEQAPVQLEVAGQLEASQLGFTTDPVEAVADGTTTTRELVARHGPGTYDLTAKATGPRTETWTANATLAVPEPPEDDQLEVNVTIEEGEPAVWLANGTDDPDDDNEPFKKRRPGWTLTTILETQHADEVNVSVLRFQGGEPITLAEDTLPVGDDPIVEHTFGHDPLPAGLLWVEAETGSTRAVRNATVVDLSTKGTLSGPHTLLGDARPWQAELTLEDRNLGSTELDPGPVFGLPDLEWTIYRGHSGGNTRPDGFQIQVGPFSGGTNGTAQTSRIPWPQGADGVAVDDGEARLPVAVHPPEDVEAGDYRLSIYEAEDELVTTGRFTLAPAPKVSLEAPPPRPGGSWPVEVTIEDRIPNTSVDLAVLHEGEPLAETNLTSNGTWRPSLPVPLPAGTNVTVEAHGRWPGRPTPGQPDAIVEATVPDLPANVTVHPVLDGQPTPAPIPVHPALAHEIELAYTAIDPNTGPLNLTDVRIDGPGATDDWRIQQDEASLRVHVPANATVGRYTIELATEGSQTNATTIPLDVAPALRLAVDGPDELELAPGEVATVNLTVRNRGNVPVPRARLVLDTRLNLTARAWNGTDWIDAGDALDVGLSPGDEAELPVRLEAHGDPGRDQVRLTLAGVLE